MKTTLTQLCVALLLHLFLSLNHKKKEPFIDKAIEKDETKEMCSEGGLLNAAISSKEEPNQNGSFSFNLNINATDTITIDSIVYSGSTYFAISMSGISGSSFAASPAFSSIYLLPNQQSTATVSATYDASQLPYYPKDLEFKVWAHTAHNSIDVAIAEVKVYFTPYNTTEIWDIADFVQLPRVWATPRTPEPARVSIAKSSIPVSTRPDLSTITQAWQTNFQEEFVTGLPYSILMEAIHPDTLIAWEIADSINSLTGGNNAVGGRTFTGTVTGRLSANIINDDGNEATIYPAGVEIKLREEDDLWKQEFGETHTDANGYFSISYNRWQSYLEGSNIELYLEIYSRNAQYDLEVVENGPINSTFNTNYKQHYWLGSKGTSYTENINWQNVGDPFKVLHWAYKGFEFSQLEVGFGAVGNGLRVRIYGNHKSSYFNAIISPTIHLVNGREKHETVIWHEFGHYAMYRLQNGYDSPCSYGDHSFNREAQNHNLAWSEGWATGYMAMIDKYYQNMDWEYGSYAFSEGLGFFDLERRERTIFVGNGLRSEYVISCALYDLYDGPSRFPVNTAASEYNDIASVNSIDNISNIGYEPNVFDDLQFSATQICAPLRSGTIPQSVADYYYKLLANANCADKNKISKVFSQNAVRPNTADATTSLSADRIGISGNLVTYGCLLNATMLQTFYTVDKNILNGLSESWNFGAFTQYATDKIVEDLTVKNGAVLGVNNNLRDGFNGAYSLNNTNMYVDACGNKITIDNGSILELGGSNKMGILTLKNGTTLTLKNGSTLSIKWGSKLILEGGTLLFEQGANVNLQDLESVIEIRDGGKIILGTNAKFKWTGTGYIKVNTTTKGVSNILASGNNATVEMRHYGWLPGGVIHKLIEVTNGSLSVDKSVAKFTLNGGTIKMGPQTMLDIEAPMYLAGVKINTLLPNTKFSGIYVYGQQNTLYLNSCVIDNADVGLRVFSIKGTANKAMVQNTNFNSCDIGVLVYGKSAEILGGTYWNNKTGISLEGAQFTSNIKGINSRGNRSGIDIVGTGTDILNLRDVHIRSNSAVGAFVVNSKIVPTCSRLYNNYSNNNMAAGRNILLREYSYLDIEPYGAKDGGRNELTSANSPSIVCQSASGFALNDGRSDFSTPSAELSFTGNLLKWPNNTTRPTVIAAQNYWKTPSTPPINFIDYRVDYSTPTFSTFLNIDGTNPLSIPSDRSDCNLPIVLPSDPKKPSAFMGKTITPLTDGTPIDIRFMQAVAKLHGTTPNYIGAITDFVSIVNHRFNSQPNIILPTGQTISEFDQWYDVIELSYKKAMEALGSGIVDGSIIVGNDIPVIVNEIFAAQTKLKQYYMLQPNAVDQLHQIRLDEALIYRLINKREIALNKIVELKNDILLSDAVITRLVNYYECFITNEIVILNTEDKLAYAVIDECRQLLEIPESIFEVIGERPEDPIWQEEFGKTGEEKNETSTSVKSNDLTLIEAISSTIEIYPNPASNLIFVKLPLDISVSEINIKDITGRLVGTFVQHQHTGVVSIPLSVENGTYFIELIDTQKTIARKKIVVVK